MRDKSDKSSRRQFLKQAGAGAGLVAASAAVPALADHHPHPTPNSITYLDRRMYVSNMEVLAHIMPGGRRGGKMQMMSVGDRRYLLQQGDIIDVSDLHKPAVYNRKCFEGGQLQAAYNKDLKKWILMTGAQAPITDSTPTAPMGKYDDPKLADKWRNFKGLRGVRFYDITDPSKVVKLSEFSTGATGSGTHRNYYDGGKYAYLDTSPDDTFIHQPSYFRPLVNGNMIIDCSDPSNPKQVSFWWVPGSRKGEEIEYEKWMWSKLVPPKVVGDQTPFAGLHGPVYVPKKLEDGGTRGYGSFGCNGFIILDLSDPSHQREIGRFEPPPQYAGMGIAFHTIYCGVLERGFVIANGETTNSDCNQIYLPNWVIDIRDEEHPVPVAQLPRPVPPQSAPYADFCFKRGRFGTHNPPHLKAPGKPHQDFIAYSYFTGGLRCYDIGNLSKPEEVAFFIPPQGGDLNDWGSWNRTVDNVLVEWDRNIIYAAADTGIYALSCPNLGKPNLDPMAVKEWSLPKLNEGAA
ncbi:MAG: twin-arginine translocation signal domain-containing protein [Acidobacteriia bacterium]|nr:twin-arginine translocation signal domain-containing protein [Terriglobia bacterium]